MKISYIIFIALFIIQMQNISFVIGQSSKIICSQSELRCSDDKTTLTKCNYQQTGFDIVKTCGSGEECQAVGSTFDCVKKPFFRMENLPFFPLISLILAIIVLILWYLLAKNRIRKYWKTK